jgi:hypothetical protein
MQDAMEKIEAWRTEHNTFRTHSSIGGLTPQEMVENSQIKCFTIKTNNDARYIIEGYHSSVSKSNYVKLDIRKVHRGVCRKRRME